MTNLLGFAVITIFAAGYLKKRMKGWGIRL
jgi:hypothetical protein